MTVAAAEYSFVPPVISMHTSPGLQSSWFMASSLNTLNLSRAGAYFVKSTVTAASTAWPGMGLKIMSGRKSWMRG